MRSNVGMTRLVRVFRTDLNRGRRVCQIVLSLDHADMGDPRFTEGLYGLPDEVEAGHQEADTSPSLDVFFLQDECGREPGFATASRNFDNDPGFAGVKGFINFCDAGDLMIP